MRAFIIGRFQPFHLGHMHLIENLTKNYDSVIIGIGSAQESHTKENPFTAGERHLMISNALENKKIYNFYLVPIEDIYRNALWVAHVEAIAPPFNHVYAANPLTRRLFQERGYNVIMPPMYKREIYSGKEIRRRMVMGENWEDLVPKEVADVIMEIDGINRIREISKTDEVQ
ncbi:MAG: nicotinamide-nucleotide adenylyltransferase [Thermoplasmata archaeon]